jgi:hypothetical protein
MHKWICCQSLMILCCLFLLGASAELAAVDFEGIASATTVQESRAGFESRAERVLQYYDSQEIPERLLENRFYTMQVLGRFFLGQDFPLYSDLILDPTVVPLAKYGTDIILIPGLCQRKGDYDFKLQELVRLIYQESRLDRPRLSPAAREKIIRNLLTAKGQDHYTHFWLGVCGRHKDTENHILMTEGSRYLTNQLLQELGETAPEYNNDKNGFHDWLLIHLQEFFKHHFDEFNSRPYQVYTVKAIGNIHSFAHEKRVKLAAEMLLNYLSALWAVQSNQGRRSVPFRRQPQFADLTTLIEGDGEMARFALLAGNFPYLHNQVYEGKLIYGAHAQMGALTQDYRVPDLLLDLIINPQSKRYFQKIHHQGVEIYSSSPSYLISAGGIWFNRFDGATGLNDGWARPTTLMLTEDDSADFSQWFRFEGRKLKRRQRNTCVFNNFACGLNFKIPANIPKSCVENSGDWVFYNLAAPGCKLNRGVYLATLVKPWKGILKEADNFGLMEVRESRELSFEQFKKLVLKQNGKQKFHQNKTNTYINSLGEPIEFQFSPVGRSEWEIISAKGERVKRKFKHWPLAEGDILKAHGDGLIRIIHPTLKQQMILDMRDPLKPNQKILPLTGNRK